MPSPTSVYLAGYQARRQRGDKPAPPIVGRLPRGHVQSTQSATSIQFKGSTLGEVLSSGELDIRIQARWCTWM